MEAMNLNHLIYETCSQFEVLDDFLAWRTSTPFQSASSTVNVMSYDRRQYALNQDVLAVKFEEPLLGFKGIAHLNSLALISKSEVAILKLGSSGSNISLNETASKPLKEIDNDVL